MPLCRKLTLLLGCFSVLLSFVMPTVKWGAHVDLVYRIGNVLHVHTYGLYKGGALELYSGMPDVQWSVETLPEARKHQANRVGGTQVGFVKEKNWARFELPQGYHKSGGFQLVITRNGYSPGIARDVTRAVRGVPYVFMRWDSGFFFGCALFFFALSFLCLGFETARSKRRVAKATGN